MRRIPDIIIVVCVIVGAASIGAGFQVVGVVSLAVAMIVGWNRNWAMDLFEGMMSFGQPAIPSVLLARQPSTSCNCGLSHGSCWSLM